MDLSLFFVSLFCVACWTHQSCPVFCVSFLDVGNRPEGGGVSQIEVHRPAATQIGKMFSMCFFVTHWIGWITILMKFDFEKTIYDYFNLANQQENEAKISSNLLFHTIY